MTAQPWLTPQAEAELRRLVTEAFDLRGSGYISDACEAISDWYWRTLPNRLERTG